MIDLMFQVDVITAQAVDRYNGDDPIFTPVSWDYVVDQGITLLLNQFNKLEVHDNRHPLS